MSIKKRKAQSTLQPGSKTLDWILPCKPVTFLWIMQNLIKHNHSIPSFPSPFLYMIKKASNKTRIPKDFTIIDLGGIITSIHCNPFLRSFTCALVFFSGSSLWNLPGQDEMRCVFGSHHVIPKEKSLDKITPLHSNQPTQYFSEMLEHQPTNMFIQPTIQPTDPPTNPTNPTTNPRSYRTSTWSYFPNCCHQLPPRKRKKVTSTSFSQTRGGCEANQTENDGKARQWRSKQGSGEISIVPKPELPYGKLKQWNIPHF